MWIYFLHQLILDYVLAKLPRAIIVANNHMRNVPNLAFYLGIDPIICMKIMDESTVHDYQHH